MTDRPDPARAQFEDDVRATLAAALGVVQIDMRNKLADTLNSAAASITLRAAVPLSEARMIERTRCAAICRRYWWLGGTIIAGKLWTDAGG